MADDRGAKQCTEIERPGAELKDSEAEIAILRESLEKLVNGGCGYEAELCGHCVAEETLAAVGGG